MRCDAPFTFSFFSLSIFFAVGPFSPFPVCADAAGETDEEEANQRLGETTITPECQSTATNEETALV